MQPEPDQAVDEQVSKLVKSIQQQVLAIISEQGITQRRLGSLMGVSNSYITHLLKYERSFSLRTVCRLAIALGYDIDIQLTELPEGPEVPEMVEDSNQDPAQDGDVSP